MPTIADLKAKYFVQAVDATLPSEPAPFTDTHCKVTPLIDCFAYNAEIEAALATVGTGATEAANANHFIFIANWWLGLRGGIYEGPPSIVSSVGPTVHSSQSYTLNPPASPVLLDILKEKARAGVDVRILGWVSFAIMDSALAQKSGAGSIAAVNAMTMESVKDLRAEPKLEKKVLLNVIAHSAGAVHNKLVVIGSDTDAVAFTGGLDFDMGRFAHPGHPGGEIWHDVTAKVQGTVVQGLYRHFTLMWQESLRRPSRSFRYEGESLPSYLPGTPTLPARMLTLAPTGSKHHVQSVRTVPKFNYSWSNCLPENVPITFAPDGIFEYKLAWRKALKAAESYIYMEDQSYWSKDILGWANEAIKARPALRVILLMSGAADPNDAAFDDAAYLTESINHGLLEGLTPAQRDQVRVFRRLGDTMVRLDETGNPIAFNIVTAADDGANALVTLNGPAGEAFAADMFGGKRLQIVDATDTTRRWDIVGNPAIAKGSPFIWRVAKGGLGVPATGIYVLAEQSGIVVHSKTVLVDDHWAIIGSGNIMRRSLYTDLEHGVAFIDEDGLAVADYRTKLWADHFRHPNPADFANLGAALHAWEPAWGIAGAAPARPPLLVPVPIPVPEVAFTSAQSNKRDWYMDVDSRDPWGGICPPGIL